MKVDHVSQRSGSHRLPLSERTSEVVLQMSLQLKWISFKTILYNYHNGLGKMLYIWPPKKDDIRNTRF